MNNIGSRNYIMAKHAGMLGDAWYEKLGKGLFSAGGSVLDWYGKSKQTEVYEKALTAVSSTKVVDYTKIALIGGGILAAVLLLRKA